MQYYFPKSDEANVSSDGNVSIRLKDEHGSLLDGDKDGSLDIRAGGTVTIFSQSSGSIGTEKNPLEIIADKLILKDLDGHDAIRTNVWMENEEGDIHLTDHVVVDGVTWGLEARNGSVIFGDEISSDKLNSSLIVINGGDARIMAGRSAA